MAPDVEVRGVRIEVLRYIPWGLDGSGSFDESDSTRSVVLPVAADA